MPTQNNNDDDEIEIVISPIDYAIMMKEVLIRLHDLLEQKGFDKANAMNLVKTAQDYLFYLEDNRRVII
jgi:5,10-methenyltetrahydromethanopterin hydrogenase